MGEELDYEELELKVGLEIHQQLNSKHKLFCSCPTQLADDSTPRREFSRYLRVVKSEVGEIDPAALYEMRKGRKIIYEAPEGHACLVEMDEEPPHELNREALTIALAIAKALNSEILDEIQAMRKIVIDGSNTTGFQRTAIVGVGGYLEDEEGKISIQTVCLEEDAARKVGEGPGFIKYNLDRLGIPLVEIATGPDIRSPEQAMRVALKIGLLLRLTGKVKRGLGTIRQDLNISIKGGEKIEVKGVGKLELIRKVVKYEAMRQLNLLKIREELSRRGLSPEKVEEEIIDVTNALKDSGSMLIQRSLKKGLKVYAVRLPGFRGILGWGLMPGRRFGTELSDYAKAWGGVTGIIHSDELPAYGISDEDKRKLYQILGLDEEKDAYLFVIADREEAFRALRAVIDRVKEAFRGIPKETRGANPDGTTKYLRPQPGSARMYPETDVPPVKIDETLLKEAEGIKPKTPEEMLRTLTEEHGLRRNMAEQLLRDPSLPTYLDLVEDYGISPHLAATTLLIHLKGLRSEGLDITKVGVEELSHLLKAVDEGGIAKEAVPEILEKYLRSEGRIDELVRKYEGLSDEELRKIVKEVVAKYSDEVARKGDKAFSLIMGKVMQVVRGRADGRKVAQVVKNEINSLIKKK